MNNARTILADLDPGLDEFRDVLDAAHEQVSEGKGQERHGQGARFKDQPWRTIERACRGFLAGQAAKKAMEAEAMREQPGYSGARYEREMLGVIVYAAMAVMAQRERDARLVEAEEAEEASGLSDIDAHGYIDTRQLRGADITADKLTYGCTGGGKSRAAAIQAAALDAATTGLSATKVWFDEAAGFTTDGWARLDVAFKHLASGLDERQQAEARLSDAQEA
jgi:hypothetical protein